MSDDQTPQGFFSLSSLIEDFLSQGREAFLGSNPDAVILLDNRGEEGKNASFHTLAGGPTGEGDSPQEKLLERMGSASWVFVLRRGDGKFASMLTVGRAANSGLRLNVPSVSKFHAYFTHVARDSCWYLSDANSSNGTFIDGAELPPSHGKVPLKNGAMLRFGPDVTGQFYEPSGIWELLQARHEVTPDETPQSEAASGKEGVV